MCLFSLFFLFSTAAIAQNTKGDKSVSNQKQVRESKGKTRAQKGNKKPKTKDISGRRLRTKDKSSANRANVGIPQPDPYQGRKKTKGNKVAKPLGRIYTAPPHERQRAWKGDLSGSPIRKIKPSKSGVARNNVYPQRGPYVNNNSKKPKKDKAKIYTRTASGELPIKRSPQNNQRAWRGNIKGGSIGTPSRTGQTKNTYKQFGAFGNHPSHKPRTSDRIRLGDRANIRFFSPSSSPWSRNKKKVTPRSASQSFLSRGKRNVYWGKISKSGKAVTTDITGRPLRARNFRSTPAGLVSRDTLRSFGRRPRGDRASKQSGRLFSTIKGQHAWSGDISGKRIRRTKPKLQLSAGKFFFPRKLSVSKEYGGAGEQFFPRKLSITKKTGEVGKPLPGGGISVRKHKRPKVETSSLPARPPGIGGTTVNKYLGNLKGRRPIKGGGSVSGKLWNNNGQPVDVNQAGDGTVRASKFQGTVKAGRPIKGGGSISGKHWNNSGQPIDVNQAGNGTVRASKFQGNTKASKPKKGGGSISGKLWNNNGQAIDVNEAGDGTVRASKFQGNIKTGKPEKGGGSISGKLWNNNEQPIDINEAGKGTVSASKFQGRTKEGSLFKRGYVQNPNASKESIKKLRPDETTYKVAGLQIKVKERKYKDKPNAADGSMPGIAPKKASVKAAEYARGVKMNWSYKHNPNSADDALKVRYSGKAMARIVDYQGNMKMHKYNDKRFHPDSKFAHGFQDNVKEERTFLMNVKLFWAKLFRKTETQPDHLKDKIRKPRYDKGESGMWND